MSRTVIKSFGSYAIPMSIDEEFGNLLNSIDSDFLAIEGLTRDYLDISKRYDEYSNEGLDTFSIEGNANATGSKNYLSRHGEVYKSFEKLLNYQLIWRKCKELYGLERANQIIREAIEGTYMIHDMTNNGIDSLYCTTLTAKKIMLEGRPYNDVHSKPPRYADSFMGQIIELIIDASSRFAGALAIPDINVAFAYYTKKEELTDKQIKQLYQRLVHLVNNPYRSGAQSPFFNMSLFTKTGLLAAFGGYEYPDGSTILDYIDEILKNQLIFARYFGQGIEDENGIKKPVAFPVVTINIIKDAIDKDYEYVEQLMEAFNKFDNVNIYLGEADKFASCCFSADTEFLLGNGQIDSFKNHKDADVIEVMLPDGDISTAIVHNYGIQKLIKIVFEANDGNKKEVYATKNHRWILDNNTWVTTADLQKGQKMLPFGNVQYMVVSMEDTEREEPVWCLEVIKKDWFVLANNLPTGNCRLINDVSKKNAINSFGAGAIGEQITGSSRVISLNLYDIALETVARYPKDHQEKYFEVLGEKMGLARDALIAQRYIVDKRLKEGFNIFHNIGWIKLEDYFSTYGAGGLHEATKVIFDGSLKEDYTDEELEWAKKVPAFMEKYADENSDDFIKLNVEFLTPLESGAKRLGRRVDIKYNKRNTFISNQLLPLPVKVSLARRLDIENTLGGATSAGGILHIGTEGEMPIDLKMNLLHKIVTKYPNVEHFAFNKTSSYCEDGHLTLANVDKCQYCNKPIVEKILRVIGYYKPVKQWSAARQEEFKKRQFSTMEEQVKFIQEDDKNE